MSRRWLRLVIAWHLFAAFRWYVNALVRLSEGTFWVTNKPWLTFAYAANFPVWEDLVWKELTDE